MPFSYVIDSNAGVIRLTLSGEITDQNVTDKQLQLVEETTDLRFPRLVDARNVTRDGLTDGMLAAIAEDVSARSHKIALVHSPGPGEALMRRYQKMLSGFGQDSQLFTDIEEAKNWLEAGSSK